MYIFVYFIIQWGCILCVCVCVCVCVYVCAHVRVHTLASLVEVEYNGL